MKLIFALFLIVFLYSIDIGFGTFDVCGTIVCWGVKHIACENKGEFSPTCVNPFLVKLTQAEKDLIVNTHNKYRNAVAGGETHLAPACRMATMQWDDDLTKMAVLHVKRCEFKPDDCHGVYYFPFSGQNVAGVGYNGYVNLKQFIQQSMELWYNESRDTTMEDINSYPNGYHEPTIGHFTVMVSEKNTRVGCAASTFTEPGQSHNSFLFTCNYATSNMIKYHTYKTCEVAGSGCLNGTNPNYSNLCAPIEKYDVNNFPGFK